MSDWISVEKRLPKTHERVLVYAPLGVHGGDEIDIDYTINDGSWMDSGCFSTITHWMPLPELPKNES